MLTANILVSIIFFKQQGEAGSWKLYDILIIRGQTPMWYVDLLYYKLLNYHGKVSNAIKQPIKMLTDTFSACSI